MYIVTAGTYILSHYIVLGIVLDDNLYTNVVFAIMKYRLRRQHEPNRREFSQCFIVSRFRRSRLANRLAALASLRFSPGFVRKGVCALVSGWRYRIQCLELVSVLQGALIEGWVWVDRYASVPTCIHFFCLQVIWCSSLKKKYCYSLKKKLLDASPEVLFTFLVRLTVKILTSQSRIA